MRKRRDGGDLQRLLADARMHETSDLAGLDEFRHALFEPPAQYDFAINIELEFLIHIASKHVPFDASQPSRDAGRFYKPPVVAIG